MGIRFSHRVRLRNIRFSFFFFCLCSKQDWLADRVHQQQPVPEPGMRSSADDPSDIVLALDAFSRLDPAGRRTVAAAVNNSTNPMNV